MLTERLRRVFQFGLGGGALLLGAAACFLLIETKPSPARNEAYARVLEVAVEKVDSGAETFPIVGYGTVRPRKQIEVVPLVSGKLIHSHENLAQGKIIPEGELLYELDSTIYEARVKQVKAEIRGFESSLARLSEEASNIESRLGNALDVLHLDKSDHLTTKRLYEDEKVGTQHDVDMSFRKYIAQKDVVDELTNSKSLIPHKKAEIEATLEGARARLQQAEYDLNATKIVCPFNARVEAVHARESQVVMAHLSIATLTDMSAFELSVGIDPREVRWLKESIRPDALNADGRQDHPEVDVRWSLHGQQFTWKGRVSRFEKVDEQTRTMRMVVEVLGANMVASVDVGEGSAAPTLAIGMFCSAELPARDLQDAIVVPRHAIHENRWVYVLEPDADYADTGFGMLGRREISILRAMDDRVLVDYRDRRGTEICELRPGEQVVVSRLTKPVVGMRVKLRDGIQDAVHVTDAREAKSKTVRLAADHIRDSAEDTPSHRLIEDN